MWFGLQIRLLVFTLVIYSVLRSLTPQPALLASVTATKFKEDDADAHKES